MNLISLKTEDNRECESIATSPYGYGTCIRLTDEQCEALGITAAPAAGTVYTLHARAVAMSVMQEVKEAGEAGPADIRMELQITDMALMPESGKSIASTLYGD